MLRLCGFDLSGEPYEDSKTDDDQQDRNHERLEHVADPPRPQRLPALDPRDGGGSKGRVFRFEESLNVAVLKVYITPLDT